MQKLVPQDKPERINMAARYNLEALLILILVASCANGVAGENSTDCEYKYTNAQMIEKFKDVMSNETGIEKYTKATKEFSMCNEKIVIIM